jgi:hypothetical protein
MKLHPELESRILAQASSVTPTRIEFSLNKMQRAKERAIKYVEPSTSQGKHNGKAFIVALVPVKVVSEANTRSHWAKRYKRFKEQQSTVLAMLYRLPRCKVPCRVTLTRIGGKKCDADNLAGSFKGVQDATAHWLQCDDGSDLIQWEYRQEPGKAVGVRIEVQEIDAGVK